MDISSAVPNIPPGIEAPSSMPLPSTRSHLLELPSELRLQIFEHVFEDWKDHFDSDKPGGKEFHQHGVMRLRANYDTTIVPAWRCCRPGILLSCKLLRREAMDVLYDKTLFYYHMNRPTRGVRCGGTFLGGGVKNLEIHVRVYHTRELEHVIGQMESILGVVPQKRKHTSVRVWLCAFNDYEGMRRDRTFQPEASDQAWLAMSRFLRLETGCVVEFTLDKSWQRGLGQARFEQLKQKANIITLPQPGRS